MEFRGLPGDVLSPESTVSGLLSSSGHLRSDLFAHEHNPTFRYKNKNYDSASAALDAYISDFEDSSHARKPFTESFVLMKSTPSTSNRPRVNIIRNKDVLREHLTDEELDFLNLPVSSLLHSSNHDRLSMTTDELLSIPYDGSMPATHTSAFIKAHSSHHHPGSPKTGSSGSVREVWDRLGSDRVMPPQHPQSAWVDGRPRCRRRPGLGLLTPEDDITDICPRSADKTAEASSWLHLPHWFTSNKTDMDCSGISSVPDLTYPAWIQCCAPSEPPSGVGSELCDDHAAPRSRAPSWVAELDDDDLDHSSQLGNDQHSLRDLRLQFAEHISLLASEKRSADLMEALVRDNRIESLIQKADQVLNSLSHNSGGVDRVVDPDGAKTQPMTQVAPPDSIKGVAPPDSEESQLASSSSQCHAVNQGSSPPAGGTAEVVTNRGAQGQSCRLRAGVALKQPGPVEALKQMLFRLQAVEAELQRRRPTSLSPTLTASLQNEETPVMRSPEPEAELQSSPGEPSLQRTLHHLSHLKILVEEAREKQEVEGEDNDEDEGRYSSSSADGITLS